MPAELRMKWVNDIFKENKKVQPILFQYNESILPNTSESSREVSLIWSEAIKNHLPKIDLLFSSEKYGDYVAEYLGIEHKHYTFDKYISASDIRNNPYLNWDFIPSQVKTFYHRKVCIVGTESTGKSTLVKKLAAYYKGDFVAEAGRDIVEDSKECSHKDLSSIAQAHAENILRQQQKLNRLLFIDTDITITQSYSRFLFKQELNVSPWIIAANACDLYLFLNNDVPFIQDGTRLHETERNKLHQSHMQAFKQSKISFIMIHGNWDQKFTQAKDIIDKTFTFS
jgi:HTH-type transcriptional repressor of NAD biosynthesis genes